MPRCIPQRSTWQSSPRAGWVSQVAQRCENLLLHQKRLRYAVGPKPYLGAMMRCFCFMLVLLKGVLVSYIHNHPYEYTRENADSPEACGATYRHHWRSRRAPAP